MKENIIVQKFTRHLLTIIRKKNTAANDETFYIINKDLLKLLRHGSLFIITSRGSVVDEEALIEQLKEHRFSAILDVYTKEPLSAQSELLTLDKHTRRGKSFGLVAIFL